MRLFAQLEGLPPRSPGLISYYLKVVDIHSHVLWGLDDGAPTEQISLEMLRMAAASGTTDIVATPHSNSEFEYRPELIDERIKYLTGLTEGNPKIHRGCDLHLSFDNIMEAIEKPQKYSINGNRYLLVECSDLHITGSMDRVLDQLLGVDLVPIVTHPERNPILQKDMKTLESWVNLGCLVQVTAMSVLGGFGKRAHKAAHHLLSTGLVHVIASDAHDPVYRHPRLDEAFAAISSQYGADLADLLLNVNPSKIVRGQFVSSEKIVPLRDGKWWKFWAGSTRSSAR